MYCSSKSNYKRVLMNVNDGIGKAQLLCFFVDLYFKQLPNTVK